jgi:GT2 family glycosyltransferase
VAPHRDAVRISVVIPTVGRPELLARCLHALRDQECEEPFEVVVVDDAPDGSVVSAPDGLTVGVVRSGGRGPAFARNMGWKAAHGEIVMFTDDDTIPDRQWIRSAVAHLEVYPTHVGVEGPTCSPAFDHLYEHSVRSDGFGAFLTCNIAYRRTALLSLGGFFEGFPSAHCEDLDLAFRAVRLGPVGRCAGMTVVHPPRPTTARALVNRGRMAASELELMRRHPDRYLRDGQSATRAALWASGVRWVRIGWWERRQLLLSPRRAVRFCVVASGQIGVTAITLARHAFGRPAH